MVDLSVAPPGQEAGRNKRNRSRNPQNKLLAKCTISEGDLIKIHVTYKSKF